jgi:hypothetical protein
MGEGLDRPEDGPEAVRKVGTRLQDRQGRPRGSTRPSGPSGPCGRPCTSS